MVPMYSWTWLWKWPTNNPDDVNSSRQLFTMCTELSFLLTKICFQAILYGKYCEAK